MTDIPLTYYVTAAVVVALLVEAVANLRLSWSRPAVAMYATVILWYLGDVVYNGIDEYYGTFTPGILNRSLVQVIAFLLSYRLWLAAGTALGLFVAEPRAAVVMRRYRMGGLLVALTGLWVPMTVVGLAFVEFDVWSIVFPPLSEEAVYPWGREGAGKGADFVVSIIEYAHMAVCGLLGVVAVLGSDKRVRTVAWAVFLVAIQMYLFQRARNRMLVVVMPAVLSYLLVAPVPVWRKLVVSAALSVVVWAWFLLIVSSRDRGLAFEERIEVVQQLNSTGQLKHYGLNMLSELGYHNVLMDNGTYKPAWGEDYFAQAAMVVPRNIWASKPLPGIDYSIARGFGGADNSIGVHATMSHGIIGQGVSNAGQWLGPTVAAFLAAGWTWILARLWSRRQEFLRLCLFLLGLGLTYNLGRDISFQILFPFVFSYLGVKAFELLRKQRWQPE